MQWNPLRNEKLLYRKLHLIYWIKVWERIDYIFCYYLEKYNPCCYRNSEPSTDRKLNERKTFGIADTSIPLWCHLQIFTYKETKISTPPNYICKYICLSWLNFKSIIMRYLVIDSCPSKYSDKFGIVILLPFNSSILKLNLPFISTAQKMIHANGLLCL